MKRKFKKNYLIVVCGECHKIRGEQHKCKMEYLSRRT